MMNGAFGREFGKVDMTLAATNLTNVVAGKFTLAGRGEPYRSITGLPLRTDRFFIEPFALRLIVTIRQ